MISVQASNPRPSQYSEEPSEDSPRGVLVGAVDVDVVVTIGRPVQVGDEIVAAMLARAGCAPEDQESGVVLSVDGDSITVMWAQGTRTTQALAALGWPAPVTVEGEVTLARNEADGVTLESWGSPDMWISGGVLAAMRAGTRAEEGIAREMYDALISAAAAVAQ